MYKSSRALRWRHLAGLGAILLSACGGGEPTAVETGRSQPQSVASAPATTIPYYTLKRIDLLSPGGSVKAKGLNAAGQVAGTAPAGSGITQAFFYNGTTTTALEPPPGQSSAFGVILNSSGQVTGAYTNPAVKAFSWTSAAGMVGSISPASSSVVQAISDDGLIVGVDSSGAFSWQGGTYTTHAPTFARFDAVNAAGTIAGTRVGSIAGIRRADTTVVSVSSSGSSFAKLINDAELVAGQVGGVSFGRAFAWQGGTAYPIGDTLATAGYVGSLAIDLNQAGQLVGHATSGATFENAGYIWSPPATNPSFIGNFPGEPLNTLPRAINNLGQVVGAAGSPQRAFTWTAATGMVDLLTRVVGAPSGLFLLDAQAINDKIVVRANTGLFLLTPADPATPVQPLLGTIQAADPVAVGAPLAMSVAFTDFNTSDTHSAVWNWGDGSNPQPGVVSEANGVGSVSGSHVYAAGGIYRVTVTVTDSGGLPATVSRDVVVYDPNGGFVSGSGWFESPQGAFIADPSLAGRADFGFVSKYKKGATVPSGQTNFQFQAANLRFRSDTYDWLVVGGARAQYKGVGTLNGMPGYKFMLTAVDGDLLGKGTPDRFRIKIWHFDAGLNADVVDYDNQIDASTAGGNSEGTAIRGGGIVIAK
jgi:probable HAF family extracellular repeat protein